MTAQTAVWQEAVTTYANNCANAFTEWQSVISEVESVTGADLASLSTKVTDITDASEELAETLTKDDGIIDKLEGELTAVSNVTEAYAEQRDTIKDLIEEYEEYINSLNTTINGKNVTTTITTTTVPTDGATSMDTGGYTGEWGPEGKLAVLHEKEIVLNA
jgi:chromosome segregation ATPase